MEFAEALGISKGITAIIGSGGKTSLLHRLALELGNSVILCTSTRIYPPTHLPVLTHVEEVKEALCVGSPQANGKLGPPEQSFATLAQLADYVLIEADGSHHLPLKAHAPHEPVIPVGCNRVITVVGASGLGRPIEETVHRHEIFHSITASPIATPEAVALALKKEALGNIVFINQADAKPREAEALLALLPRPAALGSIHKGEITCWY